MKQLEFEFVKEFNDLEAMRAEERANMDKEMDKLFADNNQRFNQIMEAFRIPRVIRDEIRLLCRWS